MDTMRRDRRGGPLQPLTLTRAVRESFREVLATPGLRGPNLMTSIEEAGLRHGVEPFKACLSLFSTTHRVESEAISTLEAIEAHRDDLSGRLLRDPGFAVAAADFLHAAEGVGWTRRRQPGVEDLAEAAGGGSFDDILTREFRRHSRSGRPLALVLLGSREAHDATRQAVYAVMKAAVRDVDRAARVLPEGVAVILPCTTGEEGCRAARRYLDLVGDDRRATWSAGVAAIPGRPADPAALAAAARAALRDALAEGQGRVRGAHTEKRRSVRRAASGGLVAGIQAGGRERPAEILDLSVGGALVHLDERIPRGQVVTLAIMEVAARPRRARLAARVVRSADSTVPGAAGSLAALVFEPPPAALPVVAEILAWLPDATARARPA
jgi:GGDEF domain-containing protein